MLLFIRTLFDFPLFNYSAESDAYITVSQLGSFWNFFSIFEGRGHQQAIAEATDYSVPLQACRLTDRTYISSPLTIASDVVCPTESDRNSTIPLFSC